MNVDAIRIDGTTKNDLRSKYINHFQKNDSCRVAVLSLKACNSGITLTAAKMVIFAELDWNPSVSKISDKNDDLIIQNTFHYPIYRH